MKKILLFSCIPALIVMVLWIAYATVFAVFDYKLRSIPEIVLICFTVVALSVSAFVFAFFYCKGKNKHSRLIVSMSIIFCITLCIIGNYSMIFVNIPERTDYISDTRVIVRTYTLLDKYDSYYEYVSPIFYGEHIKDISKN